MPKMNTNVDIWQQYINKARGSVYNKLKNLFVPSENDQQLEPMQIAENVKIHSTKCSCSAKNMGTHYKVLPNQRLQCVRQQP